MMHDSMTTAPAFETCASRKLGVVPGLDPGIHSDARQKNSYDLYTRMFIMDCRVKPGNDNRWGCGKSDAMSCAAALTPPACP
jgi:hypothetical protein